MGCPVVLVSSSVIFSPSSFIETTLKTKQEMKMKSEWHKFCSQSHKVK